MQPFRVFSYQFILLVSALFAAYVFYSDGRAELTRALKSSVNLTPGEFGATDFIEYWSSYQLYRSDKNIYDPTEQLRVQRSLKREVDTPLMMWNPPWAVVILRPFLISTFADGARRFLITNLAFLFLSVVLVYGAFRSEKNRWLQDTWEIALGCCAMTPFYPLWDALKLGQISIVLCFASACLLFSLQTKRFLLAGAAASILSLKPHLFYLVAILIAWWSIKTRNPRVIASTCLFTFGLIVITLFESPNALFDWIHTSLSPGEVQGVENVYAWRVATLSDVVKQFLNRDGLASPVDALVLPLTLSLATVVFLVWAQPEVDWLRSFPLFLALSVATAPVGWVADHIILLPLICLVVWRGTHHSPPFSISGLAPAILLGSHIVIITYRKCCTSFHHELWWIPLVVLILYIIQRPARTGLRPINGHLDLAS